MSEVTVRKTDHQRASGCSVLRAFLHSECSRLWPHFYVSSACSPQAVSSAGPVSLGWRLLPAPGSMSAGGPSWLKQHKQQYLTGYWDLILRMTPRLKTVLERMEETGDRIRRETNTVAVSAQTPVAVFILQNTENLMHLINLNIFTRSETMLWQKFT